MKSLRSWLIGIALGATLFLGTPSAKAQSPNGISYQGVLTENGSPYTGPPISMQFIFSDKSGNILFNQMDPGVVVTNGIFNTVLGPFPLNVMDFNEQYSMTIVVVDPASGISTTLPSTLLWSAPYALNAARVNGINVSTTPVNGDIFPVPLDANGKIAASMLPPISNNQLPVLIQSINEMAPDSFEDFEIKGGPGVTITSGNHSITISSDQLNPNLGVETLTALHGSSTSPAITAVDSEANGNTALMVQGGIGANNSSGIADGSGLNSGSPQTYWADEVSVPAATTTTIVIYNTLVSATSTILVTPVGVGAFGGGITVT
ncbi:MAG TPA: hypothetical protein VFX22_10525, partial [Candidatus Kapabacteria bacterium]|nr:hypothetical protein [Candidatus Kapabacteria bacterium]